MDNSFFIYLIIIYFIFYIIIHDYLPFDFKFIELFLISNYYVYLNIFIYYFIHYFIRIVHLCQKFFFSIFYYLFNFINFMVVIDQHLYLINDNDILLKLFLCLVYLMLKFYLLMLIYYLLVWIVVMLWISYQYLFCFYSLEFINLIKIKLILLGKLINKYF